jgi:hypothetical protein
MRLQIAAALAAGLVAACGSSDKKQEKAYPASPSQTGALAVAQVGGKAKVYVPLQQSPGVVRVLDGSRTGSGGARLKEIALDPVAFASGVSGDDSVMIAFGVSSPRIWFIDPATDTVTKTLVLDDVAEYGVWDFSGRSGFVSGVVVDSPRRRAYAGIWNGFAVIDLDQRAIVAKILAAPSESFGFDPVGNRIVAPFYSCALVTAPGSSTAACPVTYTATGGAPMTDGLQVIDLKDSPPTVYLFQDAAAAAPGTPLGTDPDSATFDRARGLAVIAVEGTGKHEVLDLAKATFTKATKTFTLQAADRRSVDAPMTHVATANDGAASLCGQELDPLQTVNNLIGVYGAGFTGLRRGRLPNLPGGAAWENNADPHGAVVATVAGKPVGFAVDDSRDHVARIDLAAFLAITPAGDLDEAGTAPAVTFLDGTAAAP